MDHCSPPPIHSAVRRDVSVVCFVAHPKSALRLINMHCFRRLLRHVSSARTQAFTFIWSSMNPQKLYNLAFAFVCRTILSTNLLTMRLHRACRASSAVARTPDNRLRSCPPRGIRCRPFVFLWVKKARGTSKINMTRSSSFFACCSSNCFNLRAASLYCCAISVMNLLNKIFKHSNGGLAVKETTMKKK